MTGGETMNKRLYSLNFIILFVFLLVSELNPMSTDLNSLSTAFNSPILTI